MNRGILFLAAAIAAAALATNVYADPIPVAQWDFEDSDNLGLATLGDANCNLTNSGTVSYSASGKNGGALSLAGTGYLSASTFPSVIPSGNASFTISAFVKYTQSGSLQNVTAWGQTGSNGRMNSFILASNAISQSTANAIDSTVGTWTGDGLYSASWGGGYDTLRSAAVGDNEWHQVALTYDGLTRLKTLYVDGVSIGSKTLSGNLNVTAAGFSIGSQFGGNLYSGLIDTVQIFNTALSASDVAALNTTIPEPSILVLLCIGLTGLLAYSLRRA